MQVGNTCKMGLLDFMLLSLGGGGMGFWTRDIHITYNSHKYKEPYVGYCGGSEDKIGVRQT